MRTTIPHILICSAFLSIAWAIDTRIQAVKAVLEEHGVPQSLGINIQYEALLDVEFETTSTVTPGMSLFKDDVAIAPTLRLTQTTVKYSESQRFVVAAIKLDGSKQVLSTRGFPKDSSGTDILNQVWDPYGQRKCTRVAGIAG